MAVEVLTGTAFLLSYALLGSHVRGAALDAVLITAKYCLLSFLIIGLTFIDAEWKLLPDALTIPGIAAGVLFSVFIPVFDVLFIYVLHGIPAGLRWPFPWPSSTLGLLRLISLFESVLGAIVGAAFFYFIAIAYRYVRGREGMGLGDVKLMAMIGAFLGVRLTVVTVFLASFAGSIFGIGMLLVDWRRRTNRRVTRCGEPRSIARKRAWRSARLLYANFAIPFGVFLGPMALVAVFAGPSILRWYGGLF
jgi:leader peptidase (prepilin peptidase)/N-methyltransferase